MCAFIALDAISISQARTDCEHGSRGAMDREHGCRNPLLCTTEWMLRGPSCCSVVEEHDQCVLSDFKPPQRPTTVSCMECACTPVLHLHTISSFAAALEAYTLSVPEMQRLKCSASFLTTVQLHGTCMHISRCTSIIRTFSA